LHFPASETGTIAEVTAQISCGHYISSNWPEAVSFRRPAAIQVACEKGIAFVDLPSSITWFDTAGRHLESLESERPVGEELFAQFFRAVTSLVRRTSDVENAYRSMSIVLAGRQDQARRGVPIRFETTPSRDPSLRGSHA
jgi:hypothetical protein